MLNPLRLFQQKETPITKRVIQRSISERISLVTGVLKPVRLVSILQQANQGYMQQLYDMFMEMEEKDLHLAAVLQTRQLAVVGLNWNIIPVTEDKRDVDIADFVTTEFKSIPKFRNILADLLTAIGYGFAISEIIWKQNGNKIGIENIERIRQRKFTFANSFEPRLLTAANSINGEELKPDKFIIHIPHSKSGLTNRGGLLRLCAFFYMLKSFSLKDWSIFSEIFGMPTRLGKYPQGITDEDLDVLKDAVELLGTDASAIVPDTAMIELIERKSTNTDIYKSFQEYADKKISVAVLGQTLTTEIGDTGSYAAAQTHDRVRGDLLVADAVLLAEDLKMQLINPLIRFNYGEGIPIPEFVFDYETKPDPYKEVDKDTKLFKGMKLPVAQNYLYVKYKIPVPKDDEELLEVGTGDTGFPEYSEHDDIKKKFKSENKISNILICKAAIDDITKVAADDSSSNIVSLWFDDIKKILAKAKGYERAGTAITNYLFDQRDVRSLAQPIGVSMLDAFNLGKYAVNEESKKLEFKQPSFDFGFNQAPKRMIDFLKINSFAVAHVEFKGILDKIKKELIIQAETGATYSAFMDNINAFFEKSGYSPLNPFHLETVYLQNNINCYHASKFAELSSPDMVEAFPFWRYVTMDDDLVDPRDAAMNGFVAPANDPIWQTWCPPNHFRCRCDYEVVTKYEAETQGIERGSSVPIDPNSRRQVLPDKSFRDSPANIGRKYENLINTKSAWTGMAASYTLPYWKSVKAYNITKTKQLLSETDVILQTPDEIWGVMKNGNPLLRYIKKFSDSVTGEVYYVVAKVEGGVIKEIIEITNPANARIGVPMMVGGLK